MKLYFLRIPVTNNFEMVSNIIKKKATKRYLGFPDIPPCWEQTTQHKKHFLDNNDCTTRKNYHHKIVNKRINPPVPYPNCHNFDDFVQSIATSDKYRSTLLNYYKVVFGEDPERVSVRSYTNGLIKNERVIKTLSNCSIRKLHPSEIQGELPPKYNSWPLYFTTDLADGIRLPGKRQELQDWIKECVKARTFYRNKCIQDCNVLIDKQTHDKFLLCLQILYCQNKHYHNCH